MSRAKVVALVAALISAPVIAVASGGVDWFTDDTASAALFAEDVRLGPPSVGADATEEGAADLGVAGGTLDCAPAGAGPEDAELLFQRQGERFWVTGTLSSFDGVTAVVAGPSGDVSAALAPEFLLVGDLSPGAAVQMTGTAADDGSMAATELRSVCPGAGVIDCATGDDPSFELRLEGDTFEVTGRLESVTNDQIRVLGPGLVVEIARDANTSIEGGLDAGDPVRVEGTVGDAQQLRALALALRCEDAFAAASPSPAAPTTTPEAAAEDRGEEQAVLGCERGERGPGALRFEIDDGEAKIKRATVTANDGTTLTVETPAGPVTVVIDEDTEIKGDLSAAVEVRVQGSVEDDESILAEEVKVLCPAGRGNDGDEDDEDKEGNGNGNGRGRGQGNGGGREDDEGEGGDED